MHASRTRTLIYAVSCRCRTTVLGKHTFLATEVQINVYYYSLTLISAQSCGATIRTHNTGTCISWWLHSFAVTEKYAVVPEMPLRYSSASLLASELAPFYAFDWVPASGSYMHVMCKSTGKTVRN